MPRLGLVVTSDTRIAPGTWRLAPGHPDSAVVIVRGSDLTLDLRGVVLEGAGVGTTPDASEGIAVLVEGGTGVRVLGGSLHGYRFGVVGRDTRGLAIEGVDASRGWAPRLYSGVLRESLVDWLSFHRNDSAQWRRFGAGILLERVRGGTIARSTATHAMNGLLLSHADSVRVVGNTFALNSGLGVGLYRSSHNVVAGNTLDWNVRGYSHGHYARGQDSAALLLFEQSSHNFIAWNSATHSGDGFFLWAGQHTMDTGQGGSNDNLVVGNDFRWAPTNAMEATFSRNRFVGNLAGGSTHGLWGGYGWSTEVMANCFGGNRIGIALEHGQENRIAHNRFDGDSTGIRLWANPIEPSDWGYPRHRDTRSRDHVVTGNSFAGTRVGIRASATSGLVVEANDLAGADTALALDDETRREARIATGPAGVPPACGPEAVDRTSLPAAIRDVPRAAGIAPDRPRSDILMGPWGPHDWRRPGLYPVSDPTADTVRLRVVGPSGSWFVHEGHGIAEPWHGAGQVGDTLTVVPAAGERRDWSVEVDVLVPGDAPVRLRHAVLEPATWQVRFFARPDTAGTPDGGAVARALEKAPLLTRDTRAIDLVWYRPPWPELPREHLLTEATARVVLPRGTYTLGTISDDGVRVWVDGELVIDHWEPHESALAFATLEGGEHDLRVLHHQGTGWTELRVFIERGSVRSPGSPGPH